MSPKQLDELGDKFAHEPRLRRPVHASRTGSRATTSRSTKSKYYYDKAKVQLDTIVFKIMTDPSARPQNLRAGDIQVDSTASTSTDAAGDQAATRAAVDQDDLDRVPGDHDQHREQERARQAVRERRHAARASRRICARRSSWRSTARRSTGSCSAALKLPDCYPISPVSPWYDHEALKCNLPPTWRRRRSSSRRRASRTRRCT